MAGVDGIICRCVVGLDGGWECHNWEVSGVSMVRWFDDTFGPCIDVRIVSSFEVGGELCTFTRRACLPLQTVEYRKWAPVQVSWFVSWFHGSSGVDPVASSSGWAGEANDPHLGRVS